MMTRLSVMMWMQFFVFGAWYVTFASYLSSAIKADGSRRFSDLFIGHAYGTDSIAAMVAPLLVGLLAERYLATEKVLAMLHFAGSGLLFAVSVIADPGWLYLACLAYFVCYMPTLALTSSLSFENIESPEKRFPYIRVFGTLGWIAAGVLVSSIKLTPSGFTLTFASGVGTGIETTAIPIQIAAVAQFVLATYCLTLPHTPPKHSSDKPSIGQMLGLDALSIFAQPHMIVLTIASVLICIPLKFYFTWANRFLLDIGVENAAAKMSLGQVSEVGFMLLLPIALSRFGIRWILTIGMAAWAMRYVLFANGDSSGNLWMLYGGILLHGVCYDFFIVAGQIYLDQKAPPGRRASVQCLFTFFTLGLGMYLGALVSGVVVSQLSSDAGRDWTMIWYVPALLAIAVLVPFVRFFRGHALETSSSSPAE